MVPAGRGDRGPGLEGCCLTSSALSDQWCRPAEVTGDRVLSRLEGREMRLAAQGVYQCVATDQLDSVQAAAQVLLGGRWTLKYALEHATGWSSAVREAYVGDRPVSK